MSLLRLSLFLTLLVAVVYSATFYDEKRDDASYSPLSELQSSPALRVRISADSASPDVPGTRCSNSACRSLCRALGWCAGTCLNANWCLCWC